MMKNYKKLYIPLSLMLLYIFKVHADVKFTNITQNVILKANHSVESISKPNVTASEVDLQQSLAKDTPTQNQSKIYNPLDNTHKGREHVVDTKNMKSDVPTDTAKFSDSTSITTNKKNSKYDLGNEKNDGKKIVPKKGVEYQPSSDITIAPIVKLRKKKPLITESANSEETKALERIETPSVEFVVDSKQSKKFDYVVPIVAVILSVPLVAILFSVLYKRMSEWWQHRHYRRMDFLIEGMYNN